MEMQIYTSNVHVAPRADAFGSNLLLVALIISKLNAYSVPYFPEHPGKIRTSEFGVKLKMF